MKTPEEMAIKYSYLREFADRRLDYKAKMLLEQGFLAGYQAAKDQLQPQPFHKGADVYIIDANNPLPKPMPLSIAEQDQLADADKAMNSPEKPDSWISVEERLPEIGEHGYSEDVLLLSQVGRMEVSHIEKVKRVVKWRGIEPVIETENGTPIEDFTHWMPLPKLPEEEK